MMGVRRNWRVIAAAALCCIGLAAVVLTLTNMRDREQQIIIPRFGESLMPASPGLVGLSEVEPGEIVEKTVATLSAQASETSLREGEALAADAGAILSAWLSGTAEDYFAYLDAAGCDPPPAEVWNDAADAHERWLAGTEALRAASFDPGAAIIRTVYENGALTPEVEKERLPRAYGSRFNKLSGVERAFVRDPAVLPGELDIKEVRIPMQLRGPKSGKMYNGLLGLSYAWDETRSTWMLVQVSVYGVPNGDYAVIPAF